LPYFRHKEKDISCDNKYSEKETQEHILGKQILYNRLLGIQNIGAIKNLKLEAYIPETKQRPDIYFEKDDQRFVIEFQCTPIATEYLERSELYKLANIKDIWIMGLKKYSVILNSKEQKFYKNGRNKTLEEYSHYYLDVVSKMLCCSGIKVRYLLPYKHIAKDYYVYPVDNFIFRQNKLTIDDDILSDLILLDTKYFEENQDKIIHKEKIRQIKENKIDIIKKIKLQCSDINNIELSYGKKYNDYYLWRLEIKYGLNNFTFFVKSKSIDFCWFSPPKHYSRIEKYELEAISEEQIIDYIVSTIRNKLKKYCLKGVL
jgi:competence protein CoiA